MLDLWQEPLILVAGSNGQSFVRELAGLASTCGHPAQVQSPIRKRDCEPFLVAEFAAKAFCFFMQGHGAVALRKPDETAIGLSISNE